MVFQDHCTIMTLETELILAIKIYNSSFMYITIGNTGKCSNFSYKAAGNLIAKAEA